MKKTSIVSFFVLSLFALLLVGIAAAPNLDYTHTLYQSDTVPTIDGNYVVDAEWISSGAEDFGDGAIFHDQWVMTPNILCCLIEVTDNTADAEDKLTICFDGTEAGTTTEPDGGPNPTQYDKKLEVTGHGGSETIQWFIGDGSGWTTATASAELMEFAQSLTSTPRIEAEHYVFEMNIDFHSDTSLGSPLVGYTWGEFVSYYDKSTATTQQWPPADADPVGSPDVPDSWGYITYDENSNPSPDIPESIGIITIIALSSAAVATGAILLRKRTK